MSTAQDEHAALVALLRLRPEGRSWADLTLETLARGSAVATLEALTQDGLFSLGAETQEMERAARDLQGWNAEGFTFTTVLDDDYPRRLRDIHEVPPFLFARGELRPAEPAVSVVGSRDADAQGEKMAASVAEALVEEKVAVISGLAAGIDTAAHRATLRAGGRPVGVIGTGIRLQYPAANRDLHRDVARHGVLLSQFWPDAPPRKQSFPMRNATMSGYGLATVVIQAGEFSGARIQARLAVEHGRPVILTDQVVEATAWAKEMVDRPGVSVATSTREVISNVLGLWAMQGELSSLLDPVPAL